MLLNCLVENRFVNQCSSNILINVKKVTLFEFSCIHIIMENLASEVITKCTYNTINSCIWRVIDLSLGLNIANPHLRVLYGRFPFFVVGVK